MGGAPAVGAARASSAARTMPTGALPLAGPRSPCRRPPRTFHRRRAGALLAAGAFVALLAGAVVHHGHARSDGTASGAQPAAHGHATSRPSAAQREALAAQAQERAIDRVLSYTPAVTAGGTRGNEVALTFDDGPGPYTERLVGVLNSAARAGDLLRDRRGGAILLAGNVARAALRGRRRRPHRDPPDAGLDVAARPA